MKTDTLPKLTLDQKATLLLKASIEPRRNQKRFLKDVGGSGSAEELDAVLADVRTDRQAVKASRVLKALREHGADADHDVAGRAAELLAGVLVAMANQDWTQQDMAGHLGTTQPQVSKFFNGKSDPGTQTLIRMGAAVGLRLVWR